MYQGQRYSSLVAQVLAQVHSFTTKKILKMHPFLVSIFSKYFVEKNCAYQINLFFSTKMSSHDRKHTKYIQEQNIGQKKGFSLFSLVLDQKPLEIIHTRYMNQSQYEHISMHTQYLIVRCNMHNTYYRDSSIKTVSIRTDF